MKFITFIVAITAAIPTAFASLTINTPASVVECEPTQFSWSGGQSPYYLTFVPAGQPSASPIKVFPTQTGTEYTWLVDLASGTSLSVALKDGSGAVAYSSIISIQGGSSSSCLNNSVQETGTSGSGAASTGSAASTPSGTSAGSSSGSATTSASSSGASSTSSTSASTSGAGRLSISSAFGVAGLMGLVGAALF